MEHARDVGAVAVHRAAEVAEHDVAVADRRASRSARGAGSPRSRRPRRSRSSTRSWPGREHALDELAVHVELGAARERHRRASRPRSRRPRARRRVSAAISSASFTIRIGADDVGRARRTRTTAPRAAGRARSAPTCGRRSRRDGAERRIIRRRARSGRRSPPTARSRTARAAASTRGASSRGTTSWASPVARQHEHRQPLERHRLVAGEVRQVGADRQQQHVDAELGHARPHARDAGRDVASRVDPGQAVDARRRSSFSQYVDERRRRPCACAQSSRRSRSSTRSISGTA